MDFQDFQVAAGIAVLQVEEGGKNVRTGQNSYESFLRRIRKQVLACYRCPISPENTVNFSIAS